MTRTAAAYERILHMVAESELYTLRMIDEIPGVLVETSPATTVPSSSSITSGIESSVHKSNMVTSSIPDNSLTSNKSTIPNKSVVSSSLPIPSRSTDTEEVSVSPSHTTYFTGKLSKHRIYRSLDKRQIVILQRIELERPLNDAQVIQLEKNMQMEPFDRSFSELSVVDYVPTEPTFVKHLRM